MKKLFCVCVVLFALTSSALAATPGNVQQLLTLGNQLYALQHEVDSQKPLVGVLVDPSIKNASAAIFSLAESQVALYKAPAALGPDLDLSGLQIDATLPLYIILGSDADAIWATAETILGAMPELIYAVMKGQTALLGATFDDATCTVTFIGTHPNLLVLAGQHILGLQAAPAETEKTPIAIEVPAEDNAHSEAAPVPAPEAVVHAEKAIVHAPAAETPTQEATHGATPEAPAQGGGFGGFGILLFVAALIGTVIFMDKTILKP